MVFDEAFALFSSFHLNRTFEHLQDPNLRKFFKEILCHPKHGLPVYVINNEFVLLRSHDVDLEKFIEELFTTIKHKDHSRLQLSRSLIQNMLNSMDSEWDKKVMKVLIGATHTKRELTTFGIGSRINKYTDFVLSNVEKRVELENEAKNLVTNNLKRKADNLSKLIKKEEFNLTQKRQKWNDAQLNGLKDRIEDLDEQHASTLEILSNENGRAFKQMVRRKQRSLITKKRIGMRKASQGRPQVMDEVDEHYVMQCIEEKATAHGRRNDNVMYLSHRVKKKDFLNLANRSRISRGLKAIRSVTTVYNRARPKNKRSIQAKQHHGLGLFCSKKPPKLQEDDNILTHHQRAFKKGILTMRCQKDDTEGSRFNIFISRDDKAYICPGTSTGMQSARNIRIYQPSDPTKQRVLPKYDFPERLVTATPGVNRIMSFEIETIEMKDHLKMTDSDLLVFNRPKHFIGSNGSVWASEYMRLRYEVPSAFVVDKNDVTSSASALIRISDQLKLFYLSSKENDVKQITNDSNCRYRRYEEKRVLSLLRELKLFQESVNEEPSIFCSMDISNIMVLVQKSEDLLMKLQSKPSDHHSVIWQSVQAVVNGCKNSIECLVPFLPVLKSRLHEFTDAGPGVGVTNHDVQIRCAEIILITNLDYYIRHHLSSGDSSHNEVERCQSYVGDAICDGGAICWEHKTPFEGLSDEQVAAMTIEEVEESEYNRMKHNAFKVCEELTCRMDGATAPGGYMKAFTSEDKNELFFNNHCYLKEYIATSAKEEKQCPGSNYFEMLHNFFKLHIDMGDKFIEYVKCTCRKCEHCSTTSWIGPPCDKIPKPYPDYTVSGYHYMKVEDTPVEIDGKAREIDDFQPRKQANVEFKEHRLETEDEIERFSDKFIVEKGKLRKYLEHLALLEVKRKKRMQQRHVETQKEKEKVFSEYDWQKLMCDGSLPKLKVCVLDKYLAHFNLKKRMKLKKAEKIRFIQMHIATTFGLQGNNQGPEGVGANELGMYLLEAPEDEKDSAEEGDESGEDIVLNDTHFSEASSEASSDDNSDEDEDEDCWSDESFDPENVFTKTRSGRIATNWKASEYRT